jgi:hypothetical protein
MNSSSVPMDFLQPFSKLKLTLNGFFTTIFHDHKDHEIILKTDPISSGLHLSYSMEKFNPIKEKFNPIKEVEP